MAVLFEDGRGDQGRFEAVRRPVRDHAAKTAQSLAVLLPVVGKGAEELLHLPRRPKRLDYGPFFRPKVCPVRRRWRL